MGIERSLVLRAGEGDTATLVRAMPEEAHEAQLTREETELLPVTVAELLADLRG